MRIQVWGRHVLAGKTGNMKSCAIALALKEVFKENVRVPGHVVEIGTTQYPLSKTAQNFIARFDNLKNRAEREKMARRLDVSPITVTI